MHRYLYEHRTAACSGQAIAIGSSKAELPRRFKIIAMRRLGLKTFEDGNAS